MEGFKLVFRESINAFNDNLRACFHLLCLRPASVRRPIPRRPCERKRSKAAAAQPLRKAQRQDVDADACERKKFSACRQIRSGWRWWDQIRIRRLYSADRSLSGFSSCSRRHGIRLDRQKQREKIQY